MIKENPWNTEGGRPRTDRSRRCTQERGGHWKKSQPNKGKIIREVEKSEKCCTLKQKKKILGRKTRRFNETRIEETIELGEKEDFEEAQCSNQTDSPDFETQLCHLLLCSAVNIYREERDSGQNEGEELSWRRVPGWLQKTDIGTGSDWDHLFL